MEDDGTKSDVLDYREVENWGECSEEKIPGYVRSEDNKYGDRKNDESRDYSLDCKEGIDEKRVAAKRRWRRKEAQRTRVRGERDRDRATGPGGECFQDGKTGKAHDL